MLSRLSFDSSGPRGTLESVVSLSLDILYYAKHQKAKSSNHQNRGEHTYSKVHHQRDNETCSRILWRGP